jgi:hypothetical protein
MQKLFFATFLLTFAVVTALLVVTPVWAHTDIAVVHSCEASLDSIGNLVEPVRSFADGAIRVAHISIEEPAAASEHILIFVRVPLQQGIGDDCFAVSAQSESGYRGFYALDFAKLRASYDDQKDSRYLQISAPVQPGNSGGPLLDASGHLVGIVTGKLNAAAVQRVTGDIPQNVNFALKAEVARTFLDSKSIGYQTAPSQQQLSPADVGEIARPFTVQIECEQRPDPVQHDSSSSR